MKIFEEMPLSLSRTNNLQNQNMFSHLNKTSSIPATHNIPNLTIKQEPKYDPWQSQLAMRVYKFLRGTGPKVDLIVNVSPAGGKSSPISKAWQAITEQATGLHNIPKILWVCANKTLTFEKYNDFRKDVINMLIRSINIEHGHSAQVGAGGPDKSEIKMNDNPTFQREVVIDSNNILRLSTFKDEEIRHIMSPAVANEIILGVNRLVGFEMMNNKIDISTTKIAYSCTYSYAPRIIEIWNPKLIVIDELQERFPIDNNNDELDDKITSLLKTIENAHRDSSIIMLTGSMNMSTCTSLVQILNIKTGRNFTTESTPALNRSALTIIPLIIYREEDITKLALDQIKNRSENNLIAIFSSDKIKRMSEKIISQTPEFPPEIITGYKTHSDILPKRYPGPNKYTTIKLQNIAANIKNEYGSPQWMYTHLEEMLRSDDENSKFLGRCILHKFAFILSPKNPDKTVADFNVNDVILIQELFKLGKLHTIFATTMVGVGVNLSVTDLYIPSIQIYKGKNISQSDITQLVNRAGRKPDGFANIYCHPNDIGYIKNAINELPGNHIASISFDEMKQRMDYTTMIDGTMVKMNQEKYKQVIKKHTVDFLKSLFKRS